MAIYIVLRCWRFEKLAQVIYIYSVYMPIQTFQSNLGYMRSRWNSQICFVKRRICSCTRPISWINDALCVEGSEHSALPCIGDFSPVCMYLEHARTLWFCSCFTAGDSCPCAVAVRETVRGLLPSILLTACLQSDHVTSKPLKTCFLC